MSSSRPEPPEEPTWGGYPQGTPPPPPPPPQTGYLPYEGPAQPYEPFQQYYQPAAPPRTARQRSGLTGAIISGLLAVFAFVKYGGLFLLKFGAFKTLLTMAISFGFYAWAYGPMAGAGIVVMIFLHEMGHVFEIRRQGMQATAPLFIPFFGAAIFQRSHPTDALHQAQIGIAGPISGTLASIAALVLFGATGMQFLAFWAFFGFSINLFNMIPFGMLDGAWVLSAASKWFQVVGLAMLALAVIFFHTVFSGLRISLLLFGIPALIERFRNDRNPYYRSVPVEGKVLMGLAWLALVAIQGFGAMQALYALGPRTLG
jgi:Zn-dependent protease